MGKLSRRPNLDDNVVRVTNKTTVLTTLDHIHYVAHRMGLHFIANKTEMYHWTRHDEQGTITWQGKQITTRPPVLTYLGNVVAHGSHEEQAWDLVTNQVRHDLAT